MLKIRLTRVGKKNQPLYRVIVTEHTNAAKGKYKEIIGNYNPSTKEFVVDSDKAIKWMNQGAKPSNTVAKFFELKKIKHKSVVFKKYKKLPKTKKNEESQPSTTLKTEKPIIDENAETPEVTETVEEVVSEEVESNKAKKQEELDTESNNENIDNSQEK